MSSKTVAGKDRLLLCHPTIPGYLGDNRSGGDGERDGVAVRHAALRHGPQAAEAIDQRSCLVVPLVAQRELLGFIYVDIEAWGKQGETIAKYVTKGRPLFVEGRLQTRKWQDKEGKDHSTTEVVADDVTFLGRPKNGGVRATP